MSERMLIMRMNKGTYKKSKFYISETSIITRLSNRFENSDTVKDSSLYDTQVLKGILFALGNRKSDFLDGLRESIVKDIYNYKCFNNSKVKQLIQSGFVYDAYYKFQDLIETKYPNLCYDAFALYNKVLTCLYQYFDYDKVADVSSADSVRAGSHLLGYCFMCVFERYSLEEYGKFSQEEQEAIVKARMKSINSAKKDISWQESVKSFVLKGEFLQIDCDESIKNDFAKIFERAFRPWNDDVFTDVSIENRNHPDYFKDLELENDWSLLFNIMKKDFYKPEKKTHTNEAFLFAPKYDCGELKIDTLKDNYLPFAVATSETIVEYFTCFIRDLFNKIAGTMITDIFNRNDKDRQDLSLEIKDLKSANKNFAKSINKLNLENESLKQTIEKNSEVLSKVKEEQSNSAELLELRAQIAEYESRINGLTDSLTKAQNKNLWFENRVSDLEKDIKYYDGVETTLFELQNQNNVLLSDIARIEKLEDADTDNSDFEKKYAAIKNEPIMFLGGVADMLDRLVALFPNSDVINISDNTPNFNIPNRFKYVVIYTPIVKHSFCERAESIVGRDHIIYLNIINKKLVIDELYKNIVGHKK